jgi:hypothetical protein
MKETDISKVLIEGEYATIMGVKYKRVEEPKTPAEEAYKDAYGKYPVKEVSENLTSEDNWNVVSWSAFQKGYNAAQKDYKVGEFQEQEVREWDVVRESMNQKEDYPYKKYTPEETEQSLKEAFREAVKQGVVSSVEKPKTLTDLIERWWCDVFTTHSDWDMETSIDDLVDQIQLWLPKEQSAAGSQNAYVECTVEGFNDCLNTIKRKLR